ncbi:MAG: glycosyltransferase [Candidatus Heimdallarchaeota archaeon]|nr:glycosyltransferase [Candidatus Heimdallarchaeota archaeon]
MNLSILIPTIPDRSDLFTILMNRLSQQARLKPVQILSIDDNWSMTTGAKRNKLLSIADGDYISFVDDDDQVAGDYVDVILKAIQSGLDCYGIGGHHSVNGAQKAVYDFDPKHGLNHHFRENGIKWMRYPPNHICVWKRSIALRCSFPDKSLGEDHEWASAQLLKGYSFAKIEGDLYHYDLNKSISTRFNK